MAKRSSNSDPLHLDPDELETQLAELKSRAEAEHRTISEALEACKNDPKTAEAFARLEDLRRQHRVLFGSCERDESKKVEVEGHRAMMRSMLKNSSPSRSEPSDEMLPPAYVPDPRKAKRLHELAYEIADVERDLGLVIPSERETTRELTRALLSKRTRELKDQDG